MRRSAALVVLFAASVAPATSAEEAGPPQVANSFYKEVRVKRISGLPEPARLKKLAPFLAPDLVTAFERAWREQQSFIRKHPDEKPPWIEGDLFSSLFEGVTTWKLGSAKTDGERAQVPVNLTYTGGKNTQRWTDTLLLKHTSAGWKIDDIRMGGEWAFKAGGNTLRQTLASAE